MKLRYITLVCFLFSLLLAPVSYGQDKRTEETKVADVLALLPAKDNKEAARLYKDLLSLKDDGLALVTSAVLPNGKEEGVAARYAVSLLTHHAGSREEKARVEKAYLNALKIAADTEVKAYFIDNLKVIGSNESVSSLSGMIAQDGLTHQAISALVSIGTPEARSALRSSLGKGNNG